MSGNDFHNTEIGIFNDRYSGQKPIVRSSDYTIQNLCEQVEELKAQLEEEKQKSQKLNEVLKCAYNNLAAIIKFSRPFWVDYAFHRDDGFYIIQLPGDWCVPYNAELNPGIIKVTTMDGRVVWEAGANQEPEKKGEVA